MHRKTEREMVRLAALALDVLEQREYLELTGKYNKSTGGRDTARNERHGCGELD